VYPVGPAKTFHYDAVLADGTVNTSATECVLTPVFEASNWRYMLLISYRLTAAVCCAVPMTNTAVSSSDADSLIYSISRTATTLTAAASTYVAVASAAVIKNSIW